MQADLKQQGLLPREHLVDTAYAAADILGKSQQVYGIDLVCPVHPDCSWQAQTEDAFDITCFQIDWDKQQAICPQGITSRYWSPGQGPHGKPTIQVQFPRAACRACEVRSRCTRAKADPRELTLAPKDEFLALQAARQRQQTDDFKQRYAARSGVEGTISQAAYTLGARRSRYIGLAKTHLQHVITAAAMNLTRSIAWLNEVPRSQTPKSRFAALAS